MSKNQLTTWEGLVERNMNPLTSKRMYCLARSKKDATNELERLCKKDHPSTFYVVITDVKISKD